MSPTFWITGTKLIAFVLYRIISIELPVHSLGFYIASNFQTFILLLKRKEKKLLLLLLGGSDAIFYLGTTFEKNYEIYVVLNLVFRPQVLV